MPEVTETLTFPGAARSATVRQTKIRARLVAGADEAVGYTSSQTIGGVHETHPNAAGTWSLTLEPNVNISPANTVYEIVVTYPDGRRVTRYISVPDEAGPFTMPDTDTVDPTDLVEVSRIRDLEYDSAALAGGVEIFAPDGPVSDLGWIDMGEEDADHWCHMAVLDGTIVIPEPDEAPIAIPPATSDAPSAHGGAYKDFASLGAWTGENVSVSGYWTGERPFEATPLLHVNPASTEFGIGVWPVNDVVFGDGDVDTSALFLGYVGQTNEYFEIVDTILFSSLPMDLSTQRRYRFELRSWEGDWSFWIDGVRVSDWLEIPANLLGATKHGFALDNNQSDGNDGAGGARPANKGAFEGPWTLQRLLSPADPAGVDRARAADVAYKADRRELSTHVASTSAHDAANITYDGTLTATDVEAGLDELDSDKAPLASPTFTGTVLVETGSGLVNISEAGSPQIGLRRTVESEFPSLALGYVADTQPSVGFGPSGGGGPDVFLRRDATAHLTTGTTPLGVGTPVADTDAATKGYVDDADDLKADLSGATFTGQVDVDTANGTITLLVDGAASSGASFYTGSETHPRVYVGYISTGGASGIFTGGGSGVVDTTFRRSSAGVWTLATGKITGSGTPTDATDLATKGYVDAVDAEDVGAVDVANGGRETVSTVAATGTTETIDLADGNVHDVTLDDDCTFTFSGSAASVACSWTLVLRQDGTGGHSVTWPASVDWPGGTAPTLSTAAGSVDVLTFLTVDNGTTWLGFLAGADLS